MNKTILIGMNNRFSAKANQRLMTLIGGVFLINGVINIYNENLEPIGTVLGTLMLACSLCYFIYAFIGFSENSRFAAKIKMDDSFIELKSSIWKPTSRLKWDDITLIQMGTYKIIFQFNGTFQSFFYNTSPKASVNIKRVIKEFAEKKNIQVITPEVRT